MDGLAGDLLNDLRYTLRTLVKAPAFTVAALLALTLGIGANTAIFSIVNAVLLKPVAAPDPDRVVFFMNTSPQGSVPGASPAKFALWRQQTSAVVDQSSTRRRLPTPWSITPAAACRSSFVPAA
jgi:putative ABC transport system permease protein